MEKPTRQVPLGRHDAPNALHHLRHSQSERRIRKTKRQNREKGCLAAALSILPFHNARSTLQVTKWYRDDWWNAANIVASDYVLGNNLVEESIRANRKRKKCRSHFWFGL